MNSVGAHVREQVAVEFGDREVEERPALVQTGQRERGATSDSPIGTRWATTLKKLPATAPRTAMKTI